MQTPRYKLLSLLLIFYINSNAINIPRHSIGDMHTRPIIHSQQANASAAAAEVTPSYAPQPIVQNKLAPPPEDNNLAFGLLGILLMLFGVIALLFINLAFGLAAFAVGLIITIAWLSLLKNNKNKKSEQYKMEEVVYCKNGNIYRGVIIEQIPNVSLTIKIYGGNVFVIKSDEIIKITKEPTQYN
jgi:hypothetical protein